jgi:hypothetical protein
MYKLTTLVAAAAIITLGLAAIGTTTQSAYARDSAFMDGRRQAHADYLGGVNDSSCGIDLGPGYCLNYKLGYGWEMAQLRLLH